MVRYLIVDDEAPSRANLRLALAAHPDWQLLRGMRQRRGGPRGIGRHTRSTSSSSTSRCR
jgi:hypothetical protein